MMEGGSFCINKYSDIFRIFFFRHLRYFEAHLAGFCSHSNEGSDDGGGKFLHQSNADIFQIFSNNIFEIFKIF